DDPSLAVEDLGADDYELGAAVDAAQTPPFLTTRRIVVARDLGRFRTDELDALLDYVANPLATTVLMLVGGGGQLSQKLVNAVKKSGHIIEAGTPNRPADRRTWLATRLKGSSVHLDRAADHVVAEPL